MAFFRRNSKTTKDLTSVVAPYRISFILLTTSYSLLREDAIASSRKRGRFGGVVTGPVETDRVAIEIVSGRPRQTGARGQVSNQATPRRPTVCHHPRRRGRKRPPDAQDGPRDAIRRLRTPERSAAGVRAP